MMKTFSMAAGLLASAVFANGHPDHNGYSSNYGGSGGSWSSSSEMMPMWTSTMTESVVTLSTTVLALGASSTSCTDTDMGMPTGMPSWGSWGTPPGCDMPMMVQVVQVGTLDGQLRYWPEKVRAMPGSVVQFQFNPKNHTVSESDFAHPCQPITRTAPQNLTETHPGVFSGYVPVSASPFNLTVQNIAIFNVVINSTSPTWIYCSQGTHCELGMSMVINEPENEWCPGMASMGMNMTQKTLEEYKLVAACLSVDSSGSTVYNTASGTCAPPTAPPAAGYTMATSTSVALAPTVTGPLTTSSVVMPPPAPPIVSATSPPFTPPPAPPASSATAPPIDTASVSVFQPQPVSTSSAAIGTFTGAAAPRGVNLPVVGLGAMIGVAGVLL